MRYQVGILAATIRNMLLEEGAEPIDPLIYVPDYVKRQKMQEEAAANTLTDEQLIKSMASFFGCGPGRPN